MSTLDMVRNFEEFSSQHLDKLIPFLLERKYCYNNESSRTSNNESKYDYLELGIKQPILTHNNYISQLPGFPLPDTQTKLLVNKLTNNIITKLYNLITSVKLLEEKKVNLENNKDLNKYQEDKLSNLNNELGILNNSKYIKKRHFESSHFEYNKYKFNINLAINIVLFICVIFSIFHLSKGNSIIPSTVGFYLNIIIFIFFAFYILIQLNTKNIRNKANWNQINFKNITTQDKV